MNNENIGFFLSKHYRSIMTIAAIVFLLCLLAIIAAIVSTLQPERTFVSVNVAPSNATVKIGDQTYRNGTYEFEPGEYPVEVSADGFTPKTATVNVIAHQTTPVATFLLNKAEGMAYYEKSATDIQTLSSLDDPEAQTFTKDYQRKISIHDYFPIDATYDMSEINGTSGNDLFKQTITNGSSNPQCDRAFCLLVTAYRPNEEVIRETIENLGYNYDDYEVIYDSNV